MADFTIYGPAGDTRDFLYVTGEPDVRAATPDRLVLSALIERGAFAGETAVSILRGAFDFGAGTGTIESIRQRVNGELHFAIDFARPIDVGDFFVGDIDDERVVLRGSRFDNLFASGPGADLLSGRAGDDRLVGAGGADDIRGGGGDDRLAGGAGRDSLSGGGGSDRLSGGAGNDRLTPGRGDDVCSGGGGSDTFVFRSVAEAGRRSQILDFETGSDVVDLADIDADPDAAGDDAFVFIGDAAFSGAAGELRFAGGALRGDDDGDGLADFRIIIAGEATVEAGDLLL